jgi:putative ABC transport system permease protein
VVVFKFFFKTTPLKSFAMNTYMKLAWRNLWKQKAFTALNIFGLTVAFATAILLGLAALFDLSFDTFHVNKKDLYQVYKSNQKAEGTVISTANSIPFTPALKAEVAGIKHISRYAGNSVNIQYNEKELAIGVNYVDADYLKMFTIPIVKGNAAPLNSENQVVLSEPAVKKVFGKEDPIGKVLQFKMDDGWKPFTVVAVSADMPDASTIQFDMLVRFENFMLYKRDLERWDNENHDVFIQLENNGSPAQFERSTAAFTALHYKQSIADAIRDGAKPDANGQYKQIKLLPFTDLNFTRFDKSEAKVSRTYQYMILTLSFLILFIACVNFINMSIGLSANRLREIGMRKTLGAEKKQLFFQFWGESVMVFGVSAAAGLGLAYLALPEFKRLFRSQTSFDLLQNPLILTGFIAIFFLITLLAGGYPAALLSKIGTLQSLKGKLENSSNNRLRNGLIVVQFSIAILLISCTLVIWQQLQFMRTQPTGFNTEQVIAFPLGRAMNDKVALQRLRNALQDKPSIVSVTAAGNILGRGKDGSAYTSKTGFDFKGREVVTNMLPVDHDYVETLDLQMVTGRSFNRQFKGDSMSLVINEAMLKLLNEKGDPLSPEGNRDFDALNISLAIDGNNPPFKVIGVVKDYHFQDLRRKIEPLTYIMQDGWQLNVAYVKVAPQNLAQSFDLVKNAWHTIDPTTDFQGSFLNENIDRQYRREKTLTTLITYGSVVAITLSCLGLFAVALLVVSKRRKEIGVRKVVGASVSSLTFLLSKDFLKLVGIALVIATPIAYWLMDKWLQDYAYRITLSWWFFALAGLIAVAIAFLTVSFQTVKAALMNPVKSLRTE